VVNIGDTNERAEGRMTGDESQTLPF